MKKLLIALAATVALLGAFASPVDAAKNDQERLQWFDDDTEVGSGAHTSIQRSADSIRVATHARQLQPGHAYTVWLAIFNDPELCADGCGEGDLGNGNSSVIWSGAGGVANGGGNLNVSGYLTENNPQGYQQLLTDLGAPDGGFVDAEGAEIHFVVRDHGPVTGNPDQLTSFEGDCTAGSSFGLGSGTYECTDVQFSIHMA